MQIIAKGFQTFGDDYKIDKDQMAIEIRMKRPGEQYSIYKNHPEASEGGKDADAPKPADNLPRKLPRPQPSPTRRPARRSRSEAKNTPINRFCNRARPNRLRKDSITGLFL